MNRECAIKLRSGKSLSGGFLDLLSAAALFLASSGAAFAAQGYPVAQPLTNINIRVGSLNPFEIAARLEVTRYSGDGEMEAAILDLPSLPGLRDQKYELREVLSAGQVTPPLEYPAGNPLRLLAFALDSRFDFIKGGWASLIFKTYENGCRKLDFLVFPDVEGRMRAWLSFGGPLLNVTALDITTTMPSNVTVQKASVSLGDGSVTRLNLSLLDSATCP